MKVVVSENPVRLQEAMKKRAQEVEHALDVLLPLPDGQEKRLIEAMRYAVLGGGKRLRGFLVMEVAHLFSVAPACAARVAASVEMLHAYSLVHDDLPAMDDDDLRRGQPSCHRAFDEATAILAGDALLTRAFEVLVDGDTHSDAQARCELVAALGAAAGARGMVGGQMIDMLSEGEDLSAPEVTRPSGAQDRPPDPVQRRGGRDPRPSPATAAPPYRRLWPRPWRRLSDRRRYSGC